MLFNLSQWAGISTLSNAIGASTRTLRTSNGTTARTTRKPSKRRLQTEDHTGPSATAQRDVSNNIAQSNNIAKEICQTIAQSMRKSNHMLQVKDRSERSEDARTRFAQIEV